MSQAAARDRPWSVPFLPAGPLPSPLTRTGSLAANHAAKLEFISDLYRRPIAIEQDKANEQHYEVPTSFLRLCLGPRMKYSSCMWPTARSSLADAEDAILSGYCSEARLGRGLRGVGVPSKEAGEKLGKELLAAEGDLKAVAETEPGKEGEGLRILDLGCGWGSLGLFLAEVSKASHGEIRPDVFSTTPAHPSPCSPTRVLRSSTLTLLLKRRASRTSRSSLAM